MDRGLEKTKESFFGKIARAVAGKSKVDDDVLDNLEEVLITSDVGVETTLKICDEIPELPGARRKMKLLKTRSLIVKFIVPPPQDDSLMNVPLLWLKTAPSLIWN